MDTKNTTTDYTTPSGYTYKGLSRLLLRDDHTMDILNAAPDYVCPHIVKVSDKLYNHLVKEFEITPVNTANLHKHEHSYIYNHQEGFIDICHSGTNSHHEIVIWVEPGDEEDPINNHFFNEILSKGNWVKKGLQCLLDPNHGGNISDIHLAIASLIIFG